MAARPTTLRHLWTGPTTRRSSFGASVSRAREGGLRAEMHPSGCGPSQVRRPPDERGVGSPIRHRPSGRWTSRLDAVRPARCDLALRRWPRGGRRLRRASGSAGRRGAKRTSWRPAHAPRANRGFGPVAARRRSDRHRDNRESVGIAEQSRERSIELLVIARCASASSSFGSENGGWVFQRELGCTAAGGRSVPSGNVGTAPATPRPSSACAGLSGRPNGASCAVGPHDAWRSEERGGGRFDEALPPRTAHLPSGE